MVYDEILQTLKKTTCFPYTYLFNCLTAVHCDYCPTIALLIVSYTWELSVYCNGKPWRRHPLSGQYTSSYTFSCSIFFFLCRFTLL